MGAVLSGLDVHGNHRNLGSTESNGLIYVEGPTSICLSTGHNETAALPLLLLLLLISASSFD